MSNALKAAVDALLLELKQQESEVRETKRTINNLLKRMKTEPMFEDTEETDPAHRDSGVRPDQFYGRPLATVAREVLEMRKQATSAEELIRALEAGGFDFASLGWKDSDRLRAFTITLAKNNKSFHRLPNGMFGLPDWYPEALKKRQARGTPKEPIAAEVAAEDSEDMSGASQTSL